MLELLCSPQGRVQQGGSGTEGRRGVSIAQQGGPQLLLCTGSPAPKQIPWCLS